jgi:hypothetical protein
MIFNNKEKYEGDWEDGDKNGVGIYQVNSFNNLVF